MNRAAWLLLAVWAVAAPCQATAQPGSPPAEKHAVTELLFSRHARQRMRERGVSEAAVRAAVEGGESFPYYHSGSWKKGYYARKERLFVATVGGLVVTVITGASSSYVERLKRAKP